MCEGRDLEKLGFAGTRVSAEQDVDVSPKPAMASVLKVLPRPSKQLQQYALLYVIILIDTGGCGERGGEREERRE